jgi:hypothetical protein
MWSGTVWESVVPGVIVSHTAWAGTRNIGRQVGAHARTNRILTGLNDYGYGAGCNEKTVHYGIVPDAVAIVRNTNISQDVVIAISV